MSRTPIVRRLHARARRKLSRRQFLFSTAAATAAAGIPFQGNSELFRVGILGGGAAGLAAAFELKRAGIPFKLIEASSRLGGRVFTLNDWNTSGQFIELGGELLNTTDSETLGLAKQLAAEQERALRSGRRFSPEDLRVLRFADGETDASLAESLYQVNGGLRTDKELLAAMENLAPRIEAVKKRIFGTFDGLYNYRLAGKMPKAAAQDRVSLAELFEGFSSDAEPWVLRSLLSAYEAEFGLAADEISSLNFLTMVDTDLSDGFSIFGESDEALRLGGGNSALVRALVNSLTGYGRAKIESVVDLGRALIAVRRQGSSFSCAFSSGREERFTHLIMTVPLTQLRTVDGIGLLVSPRKAQLIRELAMGQNAKTMVGFESKFWREHHPQGPPAVRGEMWLTASSGVLWETSRLQAGQGGILTHYTTGAYAREVDHRGEKVLAHLAGIFGARDLRASGAAAHFNWPSYRWTQGSFSALKPGQYSEFWGAGAEVEARGRLVFAGEHTSEKSQGFINGGYESGLRAARQLLRSLRA